MLAERTAAVDRLLVAAARELLLPAFPEGLALVAVGGYGRFHLFPYSDIDLLLLFDTDRLAATARQPLDAFLRKLWDSQLRMSQSVRTPAECTQLHDDNVELNVSLLDQRFLGGDRGVYARLAEKLPRFVQAQREPLIRHLARLTRERHCKFHDTYYHLEPDIKETPGGLRDYQIVRWLRQIRDIDGGAPELDDAFGFLARLRTGLHVAARRDANVLTFEAQDVAAEQWGMPDAAVWMRQYYRHARAVSGAAARLLEDSDARSSSLLAGFREWRARLSNAEFTVSRERVQFRSPQTLESDPEILLRLFEFVARHGVRLSPDAEQRIEARLPRLREHFAVRRTLWPALAAVFSLPHAPLALRAMHETGALGALFPELDAIECLVIRDFYHRYTVDEHTLVAIQVLDELRGAGEASRQAYAELLEEMESPAALIFALLFHDVGKGHGDKRHVDASLAAADGAMERIGMPTAVRDEVRFLIGHHLELSEIMRTRDIFDPGTARYVAGRVATVERLKALTLLTWADISAVNPTAMTPWRAGLLWQIYLVAYNELTRELETERVRAVPSGSPARDEFLEGFPMRYLRTHSEADIDEHVALAQAARARGVAVDIRRLEAAWRMVLVAGDRPFLFASVAGTLSGFGMNILKAEAFANRRGTILDTFLFADPMRTLELNPSEVDRLRHTVERVVLGKVKVSDLLRNRPRQAPPSRRSGIAPRVACDGEASATATLIQIVAQDRPGLLYDLASAISSHGANIEVVLIDTEAHKAIDVFYVTKDGAKLDPATQQTISAALRQACG
jgi:[protein-PII] uridylyltransferase